MGILRHSSSRFSRLSLGSLFFQNAERPACSTAARLRRDWMPRISARDLGKDIDHPLELASLPGRRAHLRLAQQKSVEQPGANRRFIRREAAVLEEPGQ